MRLVSSACGWVAPAVVPGAGGLAVPPPIATPTPRDGPPATAKLALDREMRADLARQRSASDGGGRALFDPGPAIR